MLDALIENTLAQIDDLAELKVTLVALLALLNICRCRLEI